MSVMKMEMCTMFDMYMATMEMDQAEIFMLRIRCMYRMMKAMILIMLDTNMVIMDMCN